MPHPEHRRRARARCLGHRHSQTLPKTAQRAPQLRRVRAAGLGSSHVPVIGDLRGIERPSPTNSEDPTSPRPHTNKHRNTHLQYATKSQPPVSTQRQPKDPANRNNTTPTNYALSTESHRAPQRRPKGSPRPSKRHRRRPRRRLALLTAAVASCSVTRRGHPARYGHPGGFPRLRAADRAGHPAPARPGRHRDGQWHPTARTQPSGPRGRWCSEVDSEMTRETSRPSPVVYPVLAPAPRAPAPQIPLTFQGFERYMGCHRDRYTPPRTERM